MCAACLARRVCTPPTRRAHVPAYPWGMRTVSLPLRALHACPPAPAHLVLAQLRILLPTLLHLRRLSPCVPSCASPSWPSSPRPPWPAVATSPAPSPPSPSRSPVQVRQSWVLAGCSVVPSRGGGHACGSLHQLWAPTSCAAHCTPCLSCRQPGGRSRPLPRAGPTPLPRLQITSAFPLLQPLPAVFADNRAINFAGKRVTYTPDADNKVDVSRSTAAPSL